MTDLKLYRLEQILNEIWVFTLYFNFMFYVNWLGRSQERLQG